MSFRWISRECTSRYSDRPYYAPTDRELNQYYRNRTDTYQFSPKDYVYENGRGGYVNNYYSDRYASPGNSRDRIAESGEPYSSPYYRDSQQYRRDPYSSHAPFSAPNVDPSDSSPSWVPKDSSREQTKAPSDSWEPRAQRPHWEPPAEKPQYNNIAPPVIKKNHIEDKEFIDSLREQIKLRENGTTSASYLGMVSNLFYRGDDRALAKLKTLVDTTEQNRQTNGNLSDKERKDLQNQLYQLRGKEQQQAQLGLATTTVLKMAPLFVPGTAGCATKRTRKSWRGASCCS